MIQEHDEGGLTYFTFPELTALGVAHVIGSRRGGVSDGPFATLNVSLSVGDATERVRENRARLGHLLGVTPEEMVTASLIHGSDVAPVNGVHKGARIPYHDALITDEPRVPLFMTFADCVPILVVDPERRALGLVHAGWRGTAAGVLPKTITTMQQRFGSQPADLIVAFGPAIGKCHYEIREDVIQAFRLLGRTPVILEPSANGTAYLDLIATNRQQASALGVRRFLEAGLCTACRTDLFFSHRAEKGRTGRFGVLAMLEA